MGKYSKFWKQREKYLYTYEGIHLYFFVVWHSQLMLFFGDTILLYNLNDLATDTCFSLVIHYHSNDLDVCELIMGVCGYLVY